MVNCAHPSHFVGVLEPPAAWLERIQGIRANASADEPRATGRGRGARRGRSGRARRRLPRAARCRLPNLDVTGGCCGTDHRHVRAIAVRSRTSGARGRCVLCDPRRMAVADMHQAEEIAAAPFDLPRLHGGARLPERGGAVARGRRGRRRSSRDAARPREGGRALGAAPAAGGRRHRPRLPRVREPERGDRPLRLGAARLQLPGARRRQRRDPAPVRHGRAEGALPRGRSSRARRARSSR